MNTLIIDGYSIAYRSFYAFNTLVTSTGLLSGCVYGFLTCIRTRKKKHADCQVIVAWDNDSLRKKAVFPAYKENRSKVGIHPQIADLKEMLTAMNITQAECLGEEADDVIATLVDKHSASGIVYILTSDKDLMQLVEDGKVILIRVQSGKDDKYYDEGAVKEEYGVSPKGISSFLAFRGDTVDCIPGVPRVRSNVIAGLVNKYGMPVDVYASLSRETLTDFERVSLSGFQRQAFINFDLTQLKKDLILSEKVGASNPEKLKPFLDKYQIRKIDPESYVGEFERITTFCNRTYDLPSLFDLEE